MAAKAMVEKMREKMRQKQQQLAGAPPAPPTNGQGEPRRAAPKAKGYRRYPEFRLPDGARFEASYDGKKELWTVTLSISGLPTDEWTAGSVHAALIALGRRWYERHGATAQVESPA